MPGCAWTLARSQCWAGGLGSTSASIRVLFRLCWLEIDGFHWFRLVSFHLPGPYIFPKGHLWLHPFPVQTGSISLFSLPEFRGEAPLLPFESVCLKGWFMSSD